MDRSRATIDLGKLHAQISKDFEEASARYHELRGQLQLIDRLIAQTQQRPVYTGGIEEPSAPDA